MCCKIKKEDEESLLQNMIYCQNCNRIMMFNNYYKHLPDCKPKDIVYGDM